MMEQLGSYYLNVAEELTDFDEWCISEGGVWGVPIPFFIHKETNEVLMTEEIARHFAELIKVHGGTDCWYELPIHDLLPPRFKDQAEKLIKGD
jgi:isoleucyl-tRNA synthetase